MTRWARPGASFRKKPHEASTWTELNFVAGTSPKDVTLVQEGIKNFPIKPEISDSLKSRSKTQNRIDSRASGYLKGNPDTSSQITSVKKQTGATLIRKFAVRKRGTDIFAKIDKRRKERRKKRLLLESSEAKIEANDFNFTSSFPTSEKGNHFSSIHNSEPKNLPVSDSQRNSRRKLHKFTKKRKRKSLSESQTEYTEQHKVSKASDPDAEMKGQSPEEPNKENLVRRIEGYNDLREKILELRKSGRSMRQNNVIQSGGFKDDRREARRIRRAEERQTKRVCFKCREVGHMLADCPLLAREEGTGICLRCGSTEHHVYKCTKKVSGGKEFPFAKCFICQEMGHLAKSCPDNPRGIYPMGGSCKECGSVEHKWWTCPTISKVKGTQAPYVTTISNSSRSADAVTEFPKEKSETASGTKPKVVKF